MKKITTERKLGVPEFINSDPGSGGNPIGGNFLRLSRGSGAGFLREFNIID